MKIYLNSIHTTPMVVQCCSLKQASQIFQVFRNENDLGQSHLEEGCGYVFNDKKVMVARVSYNGRVWGTADELILEASR